MVARGREQVDEQEASAPFPALPGERLCRPGGAFASVDATRRPSTRVRMQVRGPARRRIPGSALHHRPCIGPSWAIQSTGGEHLLPIPRSGFWLGRHNIPPDSGVLPLWDTAYTLPILKVSKLVASEHLGGMRAMVRNHLGCRIAEKSGSETVGQIAQSLSEGVFYLMLHHLGAETVEYFNISFG